MKARRRCHTNRIIYRVLLTGIHLMRTGIIEANLLRLNEEAQLEFIPDLVARKIAGSELSTLEDADILFHERQYNKLRAELESAFDTSPLPELLSENARQALNELLIKVRMKELSK
jgi:hypothetical protein